jgi:hypothetical protein
MFLCTKIVFRRIVHALHLYVGLSHVAETDRIDYLGVEEDTAEAAHHLVPTEFTLKLIHESSPFIHFLVGLPLQFYVIIYTSLTTFMYLLVF